MGRKAESALLPLQRTNGLFDESRALSGSDTGERA
jgi:hypothetical protein